MLVFLVFLGGGLNRRSGLMLTLALYSLVENLLVRALVYALHVCACALHVRAWICSFVGRGDAHLVEEKKLRVCVWGGASSGRRVKSPEFTQLGYYFFESPALRRVIFEQ